MNKSQFIFPDKDPYIKIYARSRPFERINEEQFQNKIIELDIIADSRPDWIVYTFRSPKYNKSQQLLQYAKDLLSVSFDFENNISRQEEAGSFRDIIGIHTLPNGLTFLGVLSGGDLEMGVFHMTYWDGERIRAYVPIWGNAIDRESKCALNADSIGSDLEIKRLFDLYDIKSNPAYKDLDLSNPHDADVAASRLLFDESKIRKELEMVFYEVTGPLNKPKYELYYDDLIEQSQCDFLIDLETLLNKRIPVIDKFQYNSFGIKIDNMNIIGLGLYDQNILELPPSIGKLIHLERLILDLNKLRSLPSGFADLTNLVQLNLMSNEISSDGLNCTGEFPYLKQMYLSNNQLKYFPVFLTIEKAFPVLEDLNLQNNQLETIPTEINRLERLKILSLGYNSLTEIPITIGNFNSLVGFDVSHNQLKSLPESIGRLTTLEFLYGWDNMLETLPESIGNLVELKNLVFRGNHLKILPNNIINLRKLQKLNLEGNLELRLTPMHEKWIEHLRNQGCDVLIND